MKIARLPIEYIKCGKGHSHHWLNNLPMICLPAIQHENHIERKDIFGKIKKMMHWKNNFMTNCHSKSCGSVRLKLKIRFVVVFCTKSAARWSPTSSWNAARLCLAKAERDDNSNNSRGLKDIKVESYDGLFCPQNATFYFNKICKF